MSIYQILTQSAGAVEYADCISTESTPTRNECPDKTLNSI